MTSPEWYAAKTIFKIRRLADHPAKIVYEERIVLFQATGFDDAITKAEAEAAQYCGTSGDRIYLGYVNVYNLPDETIGNGTEVYSLMRESGLAEREYLDHFYDDGNERTQIAD